MADSLVVNRNLVETDCVASRKVSQDSAHVLETVNRAISDIQSGRVTLKDNVGTLKTAVDQVRSISEQIGRISGQTGLLALNAAVEAARAGEQPG